MVQTKPVLPERLVTVIPSQPQAPQAAPARVGPFLPDIFGGGSRFLRGNKDKPGREGRAGAGDRRAGAARATKAPGNGDPCRSARRAVSSFQALGRRP